MPNLTFVASEMITNVKACQLMFERSRCEYEQKRYSQPEYTIYLYFDFTCFRILRCLL